MSAVFAATFLVSAAVLAMELVLVRALSIGHWHHFSYLVISTALLGFGAGGVIVSLGRRFLVRKSWGCLWFFGMGLGIVCPAAFYLSQEVPFDELQLIWDPRQIFYLLGYYLVFFIPFLFGGLWIALAFTVYGSQARRLYFFNMTGSGAGAAAAVGLMYFMGPEKLLLIVAGVGVFAGFIIALRMRRPYMIITIALGALGIFLFSGAGPFALKINISNQKSLTSFRAFPNVRTTAVRHSPLGRLDCLQGPALRYFPGLSLEYKGDLPAQAMIIGDGDSVSAINGISNPREAGYFDYVTSALAYHLIEAPRICVIGAGGGSDIWQALYEGAGKITAVEMNGQIIELMRSELLEYSGGLYQRQDVRIVKAEGRSFLHSDFECFEILNISMLDSFSASAAGLYALNESHLYTIEAVQQAMRRLCVGGILSITRALKSPPRDCIKMFATAAEALRARGIAEPGKHIIMIRSWATATILVCPNGFSEQQTAKAREFCRKRGFDVVHLPGINEQEVNRYHILDKPFYYEAAQRLLSEDYESSYKDYAYNIRPATDDKPYFFNFFKWRSVPHLVRTLGPQWLRFSEWGYLVLAVTLVQAILAGAIFIILPLIIAKPLRQVSFGKGAVLVYFVLLGFAYMFLEMGFIQRLTLLIGHPVFGVSVTLVGFLVFSGLGSLASERMIEKAGSARALIRNAVVAIVIIGVVELSIMHFGFGWLIGFSHLRRVVIGIILAGLPAFFMGIPFPTGLREIYGRADALVPWAWGINGFASVVGAVLGMLLAISAGFISLGVIALACYAGAAVIAGRICSDET